MTPDQQALYDEVAANLAGDFGGLTDEQLRDYRIKIVSSDLPNEETNELLAMADRGLAVIEQGTDDNVS